MKKLRGSAVAGGISMVAVGALVSVAAQAAQNSAAKNIKLQKVAAVKTSVAAVKTTAAKTTATTVAKKAQASAAVASTAVKTKTAQTKAKAAAAKPTLTSATTSATTAAPIAPATGGAAPQTTANVKTVAPQISNPIGISFEGLYHGPSTGRGTRFLPDQNGDEDGSTVQFMESTLSTSYKFTDTVKAAAALNFDWRPFAKENPGLDNQDITLTDPSLSVTHAKLIHQGNFNVLVDGRAYLPLSQKAQKVHRIIGLRSTQNTTYEMGRWTLGAATYVRYNAYSSKADIVPGNSNKDLQLYAGPQISYQITPSFSAWVLYEASTYHRYGDAFGEFAVDADGTDLEPGVSWDVTKSINVSPFLNLYPGGKMNLDSTTINLLLTAKFL